MNWLPFEAIDFRTGEAIQDYWTNFCRTGNPNGANLPDWPAFDAVDSRRWSAPTKETLPPGRT